MSAVEAYDQTQGSYTLVGGKRKKANNSRRKPRVIPRFGKRLDVYRGNAMMTTGNLKKRDLIRIVDKEGNGRIKSRKKHILGKNKKKNNLYLSGWGAEKGKFGAVRLDDKKTKKKVNKAMKAKKSMKVKKTYKKKKKGLFGLF